MSSRSIGLLSRLHPLIPSSPSRQHRVFAHPLVVLAATLGGLIVFGVLSAIPALDWLQLVLLTTGWFAIADVLRDPYH